MTLFKFYQDLKAKLGLPFFQERKRNIEDIVAFHLKKSWGELQLSTNLEISPESIGLILDSIEKYQQGYPVAYITGTQFFFETEFKVNESVLIPRFETEILVEKAIELIANKPWQVLDYGSGSGCIGLSIAKAQPTSKVFLIEKSQQAILVAEQNEKEMGLKNVSSIQFDLMSELPLPVQGAADLIVSNPPYIKRGDERVEDSVHKFEPHMALYCEDEGLELPKRWIEHSYLQLKKGGHFLFEFGQNQEKPLSDFIATTDYSIIEIITDYSGIKRFFNLKKE